MIAFPVIYNIQVHQGNPFILPVTYQEDGVPIDVSGWAGMILVRRGSYAGPLLVKIDSEVEGESGKFVHTLSSDKTSELPQTMNQPNYYNLIVFPAEGDGFILMSGLFIVHPMVEAYDEESPD